MNKRERRVAEAKAKAEAPVTQEVLEYWSTQPVGGSGLSVSIQQTLKNMAIELLEARNK